jgi:LysM repeat protein
MFEKYVIQGNDTLNTIAQRFNTTPSNILDINNFAYADMLRVGTEIVVPKNTQEYFTVYTINEGDNLYQIAKKYNINPTLLAAINGLSEEDYIYPKQEILIPKSGYSYYITNDGDTLSLVADKFNTDQNKLLELNTIYLLPGQLIVNKKI